MNRNSHSDEKDLDLQLLNQLHYSQVFVGVDVDIGINIPFIVTFLNFVKI